MSYLREHASNLTIWGQNKKVFQIRGRWIDSQAFVEVLQNSFSESFRVLFVITSQKWIQ